MESNDKLATVVKRVEIFDSERPEVKATVNLVHDHDAAGIVVKGLGLEHDPMVVVEIYDGKLRFLVYSDPDNGFEESETHEILELAPPDYT